jgi:23S rRNA (uracil1939-C5)-methyltransferase
VRVAAPVAEDEARARIDSLAYGGNGVARLDGFVVFVRRGLPGDLVRARVTKVKRGTPRRSRRRARAGADASRRRARTTRLRRLPLPGSRLRGAARGEGAPGARRARPARRAPEPPLEPIVPASRSLPLPQQARVLVHADADGPRSASTRPGRWDEVLDVESAGSRPTSATRSATRCATGRARRARGVRPGDGSRVTCATSSCARGGTPGQALVQLVTAPGERSRRATRRRAARVPRGAVDPLGVNDRPPR